MTASLILPPDFACVIFHHSLRRVLIQLCRTFDRFPLLTHTGRDSHPLFNASSPGLSARFVFQLRKPRAVRPPAAEYAQPLSYADNASLSTVTPRQLALVKPTC